MTQIEIAKLHLARLRALSPSTPDLDVADVVTLMTELYRTVELDDPSELFGDTLLVDWKSRRSPDEPMLEVKVARATVARGSEARPSWDTVMVRFEFESDVDLSSVESRGLCCATREDLEEFSALVKHSLLSPLANRHASCVEISHRYD